jgi:hypothetical protein
MGWQEREREIMPALKLLERLQRNAGKKGTRTHEETCLDRAAKIIALKSGPCRDCQGLVIKVYGDGIISPDVSLGCLYRHSPLSIHIPYVARPGEVPECSSQILFDQEEENLTA